MTKIAAIFTWCVVSLLPVTGGAATNDSPPAATAVIAEVDGMKVTLAEVEQKRADELFQARNTYYQAERKALDSYIDEHLLKQAAERENLTVEKLLDRHVSGTLPKDPPEEALRVYYEGVDTSEPYTVVRDKILEHLRQRRLEKARSTYMQSLRNQAKVAISLAPPRADIRLTDTPIRGGENAPVMVVEYADYECPYCQQLEPELKRLAVEYRGKMSLAYKDVPLPMHASAAKAAEAAHCAGVEGKFWEYHDLLFATKELESGKLKEHARTLNLNLPAFNKCLDSGAQAELVKEQLREAQRLGLAGTPTLFINGRILIGTGNYESIRELLEQELGALSGEARQTAKR